MARHGTRPVGAPRSLNRGTFLSRATLIKYNRYQASRVGLGLSDLVAAARATRPAISTGLLSVARRRAHLREGESEGWEEGEGQGQGEGESEGWEEGEGEGEGQGQGEGER